MVSVCNQLHLFTAGQVKVHNINPNAYLRFVFQAADAASWCVIT